MAKKIYKHKSSNYTYLIEHTKYEIVHTQHSFKSGSHPHILQTDTPKQSTHCYVFIFLSYWYLARAKWIKDRYLLVLVRGMG